MISFRCVIRLFVPDFGLFVQSDIVNIARILVNKEPVRQLRILILSQVDIRRISPYHTAAGTPDEVFFGRELEIREVADNCRRSSFAIIGGRRIGKTSMLRRLHNFHLPEKDFLSIYQDVSRASDYASFMDMKIHRADWKPQPPDVAPTTFGELLTVTYINSPIVVLLDEADKLIGPDRAASPAAWPLFNALRSASNNSYMQFVFGGERFLRDTVQDSSCPLFNFVNMRILGPLDFRAVEDLVLRPMKKLEIEFDSETEITHKIFEITSGHPNVVQRLCDRLLDHLNHQRRRRLSLTDLETVLDNPQFIRADFIGTYFSSATVLEHLVALIMAKDKHLTTLSEIRDILNERGIQVTLNQVDAALERLVDLRSILRRTTDGYAFAVSAFPTLISKYQRVEDLIALKSEIFSTYGDILPGQAPPDAQGALW